MIKVNYDSKTGKVIAFNKDTEPYIEITEQQRKQPLPDKYSYYAVENGQFMIKRRTPTTEEIARDTLAAKNKQITQLKKQLSDTDYKAIKYSEGLITEEEYAPIKAQRQAWRDEINQLEVI